ncbi:ribosome maturation factor RimM [Nitratifractor salsuginis]|uniref:Ribosome maturation factor RimM n=1 Tax=Nitratifractor salsuginis (strain DSM 16511 / JCM 12458 / E9I37-1) TaxID=749222 RepID=E6WZC1_NITSE|nr:ribosome maturation factor RimM [Nitratifractor salsuginis]ADV46633.1 16S rRNA processing protein RimM [Nitratifractor salsuginis DSM 16511]
MKKERFFIAQVGRIVGLGGDLKFHLHTDFPQQFKPGITLQSSRGPLTISSYNPKRGLIRFEGYESPEKARTLTNTKIYSDEEQTRELCPLKEGEHFWFEVLGAEVEEEGEPLGKVRDIQRMLDVDYLQIDTDPALKEAGFPSSFLLPYIPRYILSFDPEKRVLHTRDAKDVLEAS